MAPNYAGQQHLSATSLRETVALQSSSNGFSSRRRSMWIHAIAMQHGCIRRENKKISIETSYQLNLYLRSNAKSLANGKNRLYVRLPTLGKCVANACVS